MLSIMRALFTWYGTSWTMIAMRSLRTSSKEVLPRMTTEPRPVWNADRMPLRPRMTPPVGKSGPWDAGLDQLVDGDVRIVDDRATGIDDLAQIVGRDVGGHAHRDAAGAVDEQVRETWPAARCGSETDSS